MTPGQEVTVGGGWERREMLERVDQGVLGHPSSDQPLPRPELPLLWAGNTHLNLSTNPTQQSSGNRAFSVAASTCWNSLPAESFNAASVVTFKSSFKPLLKSSYLMVPSWQSLPQLFSILCAIYLFFPSCAVSFGPLNGTMWVRLLLFLLSSFLLFAK